MTDLERENAELRAKLAETETTLGMALAGWHREQERSARMEKRRERPSEVLCNLCGLSCKLDGDCTGFGGLVRVTILGGYDSTPGNGSGALDDMTSYVFSLCEFCCDWLFQRFVLPVETYDYGSGEDDGPWRPAAQRVAEDEWRSMKGTFAAEWARRNVARTKLDVADAHAWLVTLVQAAEDHRKEDRERYYRLREAAREAVEHHALRFGSEEWKRFAELLSEAKDGLPRERSIGLFGAATAPLVRRDAPVLFRLPPVVFVGADAGAHAIPKRAERAPAHLQALPRVR